MIATLEAAAAPAAAPPVLPERRPAGGEGGAPAASLARLALRELRGYRHLRLELDPRPVVLTGANGAGKTNLLEAVSLLAPGRGLRRARLRDIDRHGGGAWALGATIETPFGAREIETGRLDSGEGRRVSVDGRRCRGSGELASVLGVVWLTPAHDRLLAEAPSARRRFLDRLALALDPAHPARLAAYERSLHERVSLLRSGRREPAWLDALERRIAEQGVAVAAARLDLVRDLDALLAGLPGPLPRPHLAMNGAVEASLLAMPALAAEDRLAAALGASRMQDHASGGAAHGPHRSDLDVTDAETGEPGRLCSTGRQKSLLLAIVAALARLRLERLGELPVLLLDEVAAHLDPRRRAELMTHLAGLGAQAWLTGTDAATFAPLGDAAQHFHVMQGTLERR